MAQWQFAGRTDVSLSSVQSAILMAVGLQHKDMDTVSAELGLPAAQLMAMFAKIIRKFSTFFRSVLSRDIESQMPQLEDEAVREMEGETEHIDAAAVELQMTKDLDAEGADAVQALRQKELISALNLEKYAIEDMGDLDEKEAKKAAARNGVVSVKTKKPKRKTESAEQTLHRARLWLVY